MSLSADDWRDRDRAQEQILSIGPVAIRTLRELRDAQPPEAQQRIDVILPQLDQVGRESAGSGAQLPITPPPVRFEPLDALDLR